MRIHRFHAAAIFLLSSFLVAQQQPQYLTPVAGAGQKRSGQAAANDGSFGFMANKSPDGFVVTVVVPGSPAGRSGLKQGDVIAKLNGKPASDLSQMDFFSESNRRPGESLQLVLTKGGPGSTLELTAEPRSKVYPHEANTPSSVAQLILDAHANIRAILSQDGPQRVYLWLMVSNLDLASLTLDDARFFVLDGQRQQLHRITLPEIQYSIQTSVAQNMRAGSYTPPPPPTPQRQYTITGTENGNYTLNSNNGNAATMSGTSTSTYTVTPQPDYNQLGYSLGLAIRQARDRKHDQKLIEEAQKTINQWNATYLKVDSPMIPGENRTGAITYWSSQGTKGPYRVVLFIADPNTKKEQSVAFDFQ